MYRGHTIQENTASLLLGKYQTEVRSDSLLFGGDTLKEIKKRLDDYIEETQDKFVTAIEKNMKLNRRGGLHETQNTAQ